MKLIEAINIGSQTLKKIKNSSSELDSEVLMSFVLNKSKEYLYLNYNKNITKNQTDKFLKLIKRRYKYEPIAYITGEKEFYGMNFKVNKDVLIPRPETELLVDEVINFTKNNSHKIADIGTGSGTIAITLKKKLPKSNIIAVDKSIRALKVAKQNAKRNKSDIKFYKGNLLQPIINEKIDIIVANLPYIDDKEKKASKKINAEINRKTLAYEPKIALYAGKFGLEIYEKLFKQINLLKSKPKAIFCEIGHYHISELKKIVKKYFAEQSFEIKKDLAGLNRVLIIK